MAQYNITVTDDILTGLFSEERGVSKLIEQILNQILTAQATEQLQAAPYERNDERQGYRNGSRPPHRSRANGARRKMAVGPEIL